MVLLTLRKMAAGGIHDHIGGGFHRYSVDANWHVPHFEKMLYDQAQLASAYLDAFQIMGESEFATTARDILDYVRRDMTSPEGGFYSAEDADSPVAVAAVYDRRESEVALIERRYRGMTKAHSTFGRNRKSTTRLAKTRQSFRFITALKKTEMLRPEPTLMGNLSAKTF
jgi:uncharacterized protein YyaL (SSP411 family)